jgi:hypothetical protein
MVKPTRQPPQASSRRSACRQPERNTSEMWASPPRGSGWVGSWRERNGRRDQAQVPPGSRGLPSSAAVVGPSPTPPVEPDRRFSGTRRRRTGTSPPSSRAVSPSSMSRSNSWLSPTGRRRFHQPGPQPLAERVGHTRRPALCAGAGQRRAPLGRHDRTTSAPTQYSVFAATSTARPHTPPGPREARVAQARLEPTPQRQMARPAGGRHPANLSPQAAPLLHNLRQVTPGSRSARCKKRPAMPTREPPCATTRAANRWTATPPTSSPSSSPAPHAEPRGSGVAESAIAPRAGRIPTARQGSPHRLGFAALRRLDGRR